LGLTLYRIDKKKNSGKVAFAWYSKICLVLLLLVAIVTRYASS
jgi:hypothetical protein